ncbi:FadR family transcriptional regulator, partial [Candidatus Aerophobetes bacterium]|nr:FadR family transcriptional regulator [Candidatus Aerophobetes bacterium]
MDIKDIKPIKVSKISEQIAAQLKKLILKGEIKLGEKLPSEGALAKHFHVGRRSVREAIQSLVAMGLVTTRQGEGTFVTGVNLDHYMRTLAEVLDRQFLQEKTALLQLMEVRIFLETQMGIAAAKRAKEQDLRKMEECLKLQEKAITNKDIEAFNQSDLDFHQAIVNATGNEILIALHKGLTDLMLESRRKTNQLPGVTEVSLNHHKDIFRAIKKGSEEKVQQAIFYHLDKTR